MTELHLRSGHRAWVCQRGLSVTGYIVYNQIRCEWKQLLSEMDILVSDTAQLFIIYYTWFVIAAQ